MTISKTIVVVGGVAAGASAAAKARRVDEFAKIIVYEKGEYVSFANCGLPYYVGGEITNRDALLLHTPESLKRRFNLDVFVNHEVLEIHPDEHSILVKNAGIGEHFTQHYDKLILAPGAKPIVPEIEGVQAHNVRQLRTVPDAEFLEYLLSNNQVRHAVVVGGGFIGLEVVEGLLNRHVQVTLIEKANQLMTPFDNEMTSLLLEELQKKGVRIILNNGISSFEMENGVAASVELEDGTRIAGDVFILSIGVRPDVSLAVRAGIKLGNTGAIDVNEHMETSIPDIYAAGDVVEIVHLASRANVWIPLAGPANKQGRVAGANAAGGAMRFYGAYGTSIVRLGGVVAAKTGLSEKECVRHGLDYTATYSFHGHHAGYYPGAESMAVKLLSEKANGRILGAQIVGGAGVDKRIDVVATAIYGAMTVEDLENLDLAYSPPFGAAKDPIILAGMNHANVFRKEVRVYTPLQLADRMKEDGNLQVIDVREPHEWVDGVIQGAICMSLPLLRENMLQLNPNKETIVYCRSGQRSYVASRILVQHRFRDVKNLTGGYMGWMLHQFS